MPSTNNSTTVPFAQRTIALNNGTGAVPALAFGTFNATKEHLLAAIRSGIRHFDTAEGYLNERVVGEAIAAAIAEGSVKRAELFVTTKLWNTHHEPHVVRPALEASLKRLGLEYVDLYLTHFPLAVRDPNPGDYETFAFPAADGKGADVLEGVTLGATWAAMEALVDAGLTRAIGVSNYSVAQLAETVAGARIKPTVHQVELHAALPQRELRAAGAKHGIVTAAYSALGTGVGFIGATGVLHHPAVAAIAKAAGLSAGELLLRWVAEQPDVITIFRSSSEERIAATAAAASGPLPAEAVAKLEAFGAANPLRTCNLPGMAKGNEPFFGTDLPSSYAELKPQEEAAAGQKQ